MAKTRVWVMKRKLKKGCSYAVQWQNPKTGKTRTQTVGRDRAYARQKAAERREDLQQGEYREIVGISYDDFVTEHLSQIQSTQ